MIGNDVGAPVEETRLPVPVKRLYKAGELSRRTGLTRQALHQYVLMGLLEPDDVTKGGQRLFSDRAEALVKLIRNMCDNGYTLKDVKDIFIKQRA
ncbi:MAG: MerR family transcriptional regulator [Planctomycetota bacterium]